MILSENHIKRLKKLSGISILEEADNRDIIISKVGLPKEIADMAHELSDKYSIWIANSFKEKYLDTARIFQGMDDAVKDEIKAQITSGTKISHVVMKDMVSNFRTSEGEYRHILDWLRGRNNPPVMETDQINFKTLTFDEAKQRSERWHEELSRLKAGRIEDEEGDVVINFPDGFYWIKLGKSYCEKEAKAMAHCARASGILYSLRREKYPYVTVDLNEGVIQQIKGRANTKPKPEYHKYIIAFILSPVTGVKYLKSQYQPQTDFNLNDLTDEQLSEIVKRKPGLFRFSEAALKRLKPEALDSILRNTPQIFQGMNQTGMWTPEQIDYITSNIPQILEGQLSILISLNERQISTVLKVYPDIFNAARWNLIPSWTTEHTGYILNRKPEMLDHQQLELFKQSRKITDAQIDWIINNNPKILSKQNPLILLTLSKAHLKKIANGYPASFTQLLREKFTQEEMDSSTIDSEIISTLIQRIQPDIDEGHKFYNNFFRLPKNKVTAEHLKYILEHYTVTFVIANMDNMFNYPKVAEGASEIIQYILDNKLNGLNAFKKIEHWPLTDKQKQFIIDKQIDGDIDILETQDLSNMNFSKSQIAKLIKEQPELFNPNEQDYNKLGITDDGIIYIVSKSPGTIPEKKVEEMLSPESMVKLFKKNPKWTDAVYLVAKYQGYEGVKGLKEGSSGGFEPDYVEILYDEWQDEELAELFDEPDVIKRIANYELDFHGYDYKFNDIDGSFSDLDEENIAYVKYLLGKAFTEDKNLGDVKKKEIKNVIKGKRDSELADIIGDPDEFKDEHEIQNYNEHIVEELKNAYIWAVEDAQRNADEDEYWKLFTNPVKEFLGEPDWKEKTVEVTDKKTFKKKKEKKRFLKFKMKYPEFLDLLKEYEEYNSSEDEYSVRLSDGKIYPTDIIRGALQNRGEQLKFEEPRYGVNGDMDDDNLNELFSDRIHDQFSEELKGAKVVEKKKS